MSELISETQKYILVVDDEAILRRMISVVLESAGYKVASASCGRDALRMIGERRPDLVTLDVMMPEISGVQVADQLAQNPATADLPVILLTALDESTDPELRRQVREHNARLMPKPFSRHQLLEMVRSALSIPDPRR
jgi:CheY-like chemotaxis protein